MNISVSLDKGSEAADAVANEVIAATEYHQIQKEVIFILFVELDTILSELCPQSVQHVIMV